MLTPTHRKLIRARHELRHIQALIHAYTLRATELGREINTLETQHINEEIALHIEQGNYTICPRANPSYSGQNSITTRADRSTRTRKSRPATIDNAKRILSKLSPTEMAALLSTLGV